MSRNIEIWQDNVLTTARYEMSEAEKNILYMVIAQVKPDDPVDKMYQVGIKEMMQVTGAKELKFDTYRQATRKLLTRVFETILPTGNVLQATFIASAEYKAGTGIIEIELSRKVRPLYVDLHTKFTKMQLVAAISLKSAYAKRIYELMCMYKNMPDKTFLRDLIDLKTILGIINPKTGKDSYSNWTRFQKNVLDVATKEINGNTDLSFNYKPVMGDRPGRGRKPVVAVQFEVLYTAKTETETVSISAIHEQLIKQFKLRPDQADNIIARYSVEDIKKHIHAIMVTLSDGKVRNVGAYTAKIFGVSTKS